MNTPVLLASLTLLAAAPQEPAQVPEIDASSWLNHFGQPPSLEALAGKVVLIEAWATW